MKRHTFGHPSAVVAAGMAIVAVASVTLAAPVDISWRDTVDIRIKAGVGLLDAAFEGRFAAIVWGEETDGQTTARVRTSTDAGATWSRTTVFDNTEGAAVTICGDQIEVALSRRVRPGERAIDVAFGDVGGGLFKVSRVAGGTGFRWNLDAACTDGRVFVSWYQRDGGPSRRLIAHALLATHKFGKATDMGLDRTNYDGYFAPRGFHIAASGDAAYAVFGAADGKLRFKRWSVGPAPDHKVTSRPIQVISGGSDDCPAELPVVGADGQTVAVAWDRNSFVLARVSTDRGLAWGDTREIIDEFDCDSIWEGGQAPVAMAVRGSHIALTWASCGPPFCTSLVSRTRDGFRHSSRAVLGDDQTHFVGFLRVDGRLRLADAFSGTHRVRFRLAL